MEKCLFGVNLGYPVLAPLTIRVTQRRIPGIQECDGTDGREAGTAVVVVLVVRCRTTKDTQTTLIRVHAAVRSPAVEDSAENSVSYFGGIKAETGKQGIDFRGAKGGSTGKSLFHRAATKSERGGGKGPP